MMVGKLLAVNQIARLDLTRRLKEPQNYSEFQYYRPPALAADRLAAVPRLERALEYTGWALGLAPQKTH